MINTHGLAHYVVSPVVKHAALTGRFWVEMATGNLGCFMELFCFSQALDDVGARICDYYPRTYAGFAYVFGLRYGTFPKRLDIIAAALLASGAQCLRRWS